MHGLMLAIHNNPQQSQHEWRQVGARSVAAEFGLRSNSLPELKCPHPARYYWMVTTIPFAHRAEGEDHAKGKV